MADLRDITERIVDPAIGVLMATRKEAANEIANLRLANDEARKTIDWLCAMIPQPANNGGPAHG